GQRKIDVEPIFANLKAHLAFKRFSVRGLSATWNEVGIALMANNLIKLAKVSVNLKGYGQKQEGNSRFVRISFLFFIEFELCPELFLFGKKHRPLLAGVE
ncbi:MAG TPA: transposase, partial [Levilactobacillus brevis]|nr:transposase [Levilactobacillus brevis]